MSSTAVRSARGSSSRALVVGVPVVLGAALLLTMDLLAPDFFRGQNFLNILVQTSPLGVMAVGETFVLLCGGIDLSIPANVAFAAVLGAFVMPTAGVGAGLLTMLAVGGAVGLFNGIAVALLGMTPFVVTLATMMVLGGATTWMTNSQSVSNFPDAFFNLLMASPGGVPVSVILLILVMTVGSVAVSYTGFGRSLYAVGLNQKAARIVRINVRAVLLTTYVIAGVLAGLTAAMLTAWLGSASASLGNEGVILDIITACVIGGVSIYGGSGRPFGAVLGAVLVTLISNTLNQLGVSYFMNLVIKGVVIIGFICLDRVTWRRLQ